MMKCERCNTVFEDPKIIRDSRPDHFGHPCSEEYVVCPHCGSDDIWEAERCLQCAEYVDKLEIEDGLCPKCVGNVMERCTEFLATFSSAEREFLSAQGGIGSEAVV